MNNNNSNTDSRFGLAHQGLLRLFQSQFFSAWMAVWYLYKYGPYNDGIQDYLCDQLLHKFSIAQVLEYLPQLIHLLIAYPNLNHLYDLILDWARLSPHFSLLTLWYLQSYLADDSAITTNTLDPIHANQLVQQLYLSITQIIQGVTPSCDKGLLNNATTGPPPPLLLPLNLIPPPTYISEPNIIIQNHKNTTSSPQSSSADPPTKSKSKTFSSKLLSNFNLGPERTSNSPSLEDLHKGRVFSFTHFVQQLTKSSSSSSVSKLQDTDFQIPSSNHPFPTTTTTTTTTVTESVSSPLSHSVQLIPYNTIPDTTVTTDTVPNPPADPTLLQHYYYHSELQFMAALTSISDRLLAVPREARQSSLTAELTLLNHNFPAPVCLPLWCNATEQKSNQARHHQIVRISPTDAVVLNSADRVPFLLFIEVIDDDYDQSIGDDDPGVRDGSDLHNLSMDVASKIIVTSDTALSPNSHLRTSADRLPRPIVRRRSSLSLLTKFLATSPSSVPLPSSSGTEHSSGSEESIPGSSQSPRSILPFLRKSPSTPVMRQNELVDTDSDRLISHHQPFHTSTSILSVPAVVPGFLTASEFEDRMRTAAVLLAQLTLQESVVSPSVDTPKSKRRNTTAMKNKPIQAAPGNHMEEIRGRILREMMALEDRRVAEMKSWTEATTGSGHKLIANQRSHMVSSDTDSLPLPGMNGSPIPAPIVVSMKPVVSVSTAPVSPNIDSSSSSWNRRHRQGSVPSHLSKLSTDSVSSPNLSGTPQGHVIERDKDDPSSAVVRETWSAKEARIRSFSPFGRHPKWALHSVIVKSGADLRQEQLACQLMTELQRIFMAGTGCWLAPYRVLVTGAGHGMIETVRNTVSLHSLKKDAYMHVGDHFTLKHYFVREFGPESSTKYRRAVNNFIASLAGYSVACYVLSVKDRHNGNILLDYTTGHLVHIDFGFMLSNSPGAVAFESAPFKLSHEYVELMDGMGSEKYRDWRNRVVHGFLALRRDHDQLAGLVEIMERNSRLDCFASKSATMSIAQAAAVSGPNSPDRSLSLIAPASQLMTVPASSSATSLSTSLGGASMEQSCGGLSPSSIGPPVMLPVAAALKDRLMLGMTDAQVAEHVDKLIAQSVGNVFTRLYDGYQYYTQGVMA